MNEIRFRAWGGSRGKGYKMHGYQYRKAEYHPLATSRGYVLEHRLMMENHLGKYLPEGAVVHHKNGVRDDNRLDNLEYIPEQSRHAKQHDTGIRNSNGQFVACSPEFANKKFRLYNKNSKQMQVFTLAKLISTTFRRSQFEYRGEFTGLKDKNGKEIYYGDLLAFEAWEWYRPKVVDKDYIFQVEQSETGEWVGAGICTEWATYCEIVGNVYETPELLEKDDE